ncbi:hydroxyisourate hydrolase [Nonomuraea sp. 10N515B]|uniref:hydroxyisourate hydrolase n=1 Tax=Nonomuraea sp. 10N515B TaxID=3457422 RepID=UPI003FCE2DBF
MNVSVRALDGAFGRPVAGMKASLKIFGRGGWELVADAVTDGAGGIDEWPCRPLRRGLYRIVFDSQHYFVGLGVAAAYPEISALFRIRDELSTCRLHVQIAPHAYSIYFGLTI